MIYFDIQIKQIDKDLFKVSYSKSILERYYFHCKKDEIGNRIQKIFM
jgi:hypothetical protein